MSYIIKNSGQGQLVARLTDAGRKKLSEGRLNIQLFQIGDTEMCYDCYTNSTSESYGQNILQAEHNAQNLNPCPHKNKGHIKYPITEGTALSGNTFGPTLFVGGPQTVYNTATPRGFFYNTGDTTSPFNGGGGSFSAYTDGGVSTGIGRVLTSNWCFPVSAMTGGSAIRIFSANTNCDGMMYTPQTGDLLSVTYELNQGANNHPCSQISYTAASPTLFYQIVSNTGLVSGDTGLNNIELTIDRNIPNLTQYADQYYSAFTGNCINVRVYPSYTGLTGMRTYYGNNTPISYWCDDTLSFDNCCTISNEDVNIWNMNINWTHTVAGTWTGNFLNVNDYGSSGYSGTKEYLQYQSSQGGRYTDIMTDSYDTNVFGGTWYLDSFNKERVVIPEDQKCVAILHYTNEATTDFYGEKLALEEQGFLPGTTIGEARNFKLHMPTLMWHRKRNTGTGQGNEHQYGQTFFVDPPVTNSVFPNCPHYLQSTVNSNMNDEGLRYYHLWDDIEKPIYSGSTAPTAGPMRVGKVFPDYKMVVIDDQELIVAMSYKSDRSWTLPTPTHSCVSPGSNCDGPTCPDFGVFTGPNQTIWVTYLLSSSSGFTSGLHCNNYISHTRDAGDPNCDIMVQWGAEFPYLRQFTQNGAGVFSGGTGFEADRLYLLAQTQPTGTQPDPATWKQIEVTGLIPNHTVGNPIDAVQLTQENAKFYVTGVHLNPSCPNYSAQTNYRLNQYISIPSATTVTTHNALNFGDEYFFYGTLESDIMATIYEMKHQVILGTNQYLTSTNPSFADYTLSNGVAPDVKLTEVGLFDNENGKPDLMAIAKMQNPTIRTGNQQFIINIDF